MDCVGVPRAELGNIKNSSVQSEHFPVPVCGDGLHVSVYGNVPQKTSHTDLHER